MPPCFCSFSPPSTSISKFISAQPFLSMLETECSTIQDLKIIHAQLVKTGLVKDTIAASRVLAFCATSPACDMDYALSIFRKIENLNLFTWNTIIRGFSQSSSPHVAIYLFIEMLSSAVLPGTLTYPSVFKAYSQLGLAKDGAQLHGRIIKQGMGFDTFIRNSVIHMYSSCGLLGDARKLFDEDEVFDVVAWNSIIMGLAKCGEVEESFRLFHEMSFRNEISWNTMISGYVRNGKWMEALNLFEQMQGEKNIKPSEFTLVSLLNACARLGAFKQGKWIHDYIKKNNIELNVIVMTALTDMYCKCGNIEMAQKVFASAPRKGLSSWNSMLLGLATNGFENETIELFLQLNSSSLRPDAVTFIGVLTACNHSGQVDLAREYFLLMKQEYKIEPSIEHYGCMVDVLGRAGLMEEAVELIKSMPMNPDAVIWGSLLSSCYRYCNVDIAQWAAENLLLSDPDDPSAHVLMSNVYAASGHFKKAIQERALIKNKQMQKQPGCSLIEVNGEVHEFVAGGKWQFQVPDLWSIQNETVMIEG
ncbi:pentatricopeptide repeat-containing protein chloroplastic-like [Dorcoceras hygrometricum]|uniref:Pentatricopeptide repeat-containing protein chloroplastic-like n=1 Tax=Dorcoceras hygrometricum TaxID=472368 RepID=A0A2Z7AJW6_9LAMI|nr:pentatricopeptide repeat-containing protein chloroplastic-like [Dorcoceras hygrometricum]